MAMTYQNFASLGVNLNRQKYGPLDISNVFTSAADLKYYLSKGTFTEGVSEYWYKNANEKIVPYPYEGQVLATVIDGVVSVYALSLDAEGNFQTQEIGAKVEVDGTTIVKDAGGKLSIVAPADPDSSKTYNFAYANGVYSWVEVDTATAAGQAQEINSLKQRASVLEDTVNGKAAEGVEGEDGYKPAVPGLVDKVADQAAEIAALSGDISTALQDAKDYADTQIEANAYDDTELAGRVSTLETTSGNHETRIAEVEKFFAVTGEDTIAAALDTLVEIQKEIASDDASAAAMLASINANTDAITLLNKTDGTVGSVKKTIDDAIAAENLGQYATVTALNGVAEDVAGLENALLGYATNDTISTINAALARKIESGTIAHAVPAVEADPDNGIEGTAGVPEGVTVDGTVLKIIVDAPTRAETTQMIADKVAAVTGGESAAAVKLSLEAEIERATAKDTAHDKALEILNGSGAGSVAAAYAKGEEGVAAAAAVAADLVTANATIADNTREIGVVKGQVSTLNTTLTEKITALEGKDTTIEGNITALQTTVGGHTTTIAGHTASIASLEDKDTELAALIQANTTKFADYYTSSQVDAKVKEVSDAVGAIDLTPYAKAADVNTSIQNITADLATKANAADVYTKEAADAEFMTEAEVDARIDALIVAADPENGKTITNIQNLVKYVDENAGEIAKLVTDVATNKAAHEKNAEDISTNVAAIAAINGTLAAMIQPKASDEISVGTDGALGIKAVNVNKLVQTEGDTLVLNGGSAAV